MNEILLAFAPFALALLILLVTYLIGIPLRPYLLYGKMERIPHFITPPEGSISLVREKKIESISKLTSGRVKSICGEFRGFKAIEHVLKKGLSADVVCGPCVWNGNNRKNITRLMEEYPDTLNIYILRERPERHAMLIGSHFFLEDPHEFNKDYETAIEIENTTEDFISHFNTQFEKMKAKGKIATISDIKNLGLYNQ